LLLIPSTVIGMALLGFTHRYKGPASDLEACMIPHLARTSRWLVSLGVIVRCIEGRVTEIFAKQAAASV